MSTAMIDCDYYQREIAPCLPPVVLDFHTHTWNAETWKEKPWDTEKSGGRYMVTDAFYPPEQLLADGRACFPDRGYEAVCFGYPTPAVDWEKDTAYVAAAARNNAGLWPLLLALWLLRHRYGRPGLVNVACDSANPTDRTEPSDPSDQQEHQPRKTPK